MIQNKVGDDHKLSNLSELDKELTDIKLSDLPNGATLTAQELYVLEQAGFQTVNVVIGNIVYSMGLRGVLKSVQRVFTRGEMIEFTHMNKDAREVARNRMLLEARKIEADTVIDIIFETHEYADFIEITCIGTAVKRVTTAKKIDVVLGS